MGLISMVKYTGAQTGSGVLLSKERENNVYKAGLCLESKHQCFGSHKGDKIKIARPVLTPPALA